MPFDYEALVGHLNVIGGRAITTQPPGALVEVAPVRAARGRETDTIFVLVLPTANHTAPASFYEEMARLAAEEYFDSSGSVTAGLRSVFNMLNQNLMEHNQVRGNRQYEAHIVCAVLRGVDLIVGRVGASVLLLMQPGDPTTKRPGQLESIPPDLQDTSQLESPPLGVQAGVDARLSRHRVTAGTRMVMADANVTQFDGMALRSALASVDIGMTLVAFKEMARLQLMMLAVEFVPPEVPAPVPVPMGESMTGVLEAERQKAQQRDRQRQRRGGTPTGVSKAGEQIADRTRQGVGVAAQGLARGMTVTNKAIEHYFTEPEPDQKRWYNRPYVTGAAIFIPILIVGMVVMLWLSGTGESAFEQCLGEATNAVEFARSVDSGNPDNVLAAWTAVINVSRSCEEFREGDNTINSYIIEGQIVLDRINQVERRDPIILDVLEDSILTRIIVRGFDIYVLDSQNPRVYRGTLTEDGRAMEVAFSPIPEMREGATVSGFTVGAIIDIAYSETAAELFAIDRNGVLIRCSRQFTTRGCRAEQLLRTEQWNNPVAITLYDSNANLYVLDPGSRQIWRYEQSGSLYDQIPTGYFDGQNQGNIGNAVDMAINNNGNIFVLLADGFMFRYLSAEPQPFSIGNFPTNQAPDFVEAMHYDEDPLGDGIYMVNRTGRSIHEITLGGLFAATYRVSDEDLFARVADVSADAGRGVIYTVSGGTIMALEK